MVFLLHVNIFQILFALLLVRGAFLFLQMIAHTITLGFAKVVSVVHRRVHRTHLT